jgi:hypothetical protein
MEAASQVKTNTKKLWWGKMEEKKKLECSLTSSWGPDTITLSVNVLGRAWDVYSFHKIRLFEGVTNAYFSDEPKILTYCQVLLWVERRRFWDPSWTFNTWSPSSQRGLFEKS